MRSSERGSVINSNRRSSSNNTNDYDYINNDDGNGEKKVGSGDSARHILTHSPTPFHFPSLTIITFNNLHIYNLDIQTPDDDH